MTDTVIPSEKKQSFFTTSPDIKEYNSWEDMDLKEEVLHGLYAAEFNYPSKIQSMAVVPMREGRDIIAQAQSGKGKTGAFITGILERIDNENKQTQAIILANTKELAEQIKFNFDMFSGYTNTTSLLCIGKLSKEDNDQLNNDLINNKGQVIIGTPGKILSLLMKKRIRTSNMKVLVLDEADELLGINFEDQIKAIISTIPIDCQICIFSATYNKRSIYQTKNFMLDENNIRKVIIKQENLSLEDIKQYYIFLSDEYKLGSLLDLYGVFSIAQTIIYVNRKDQLEALATKLKENNYTCGILHGDIGSQERVETMRAFRKGTIRVLIASDLIARGIDVEQVKVVINYDLPRRKETYIHRIGRTGRFGRKGIALNFITKNDERLVELIMKHNNTKIEPLPKKDEFQKIMKDLIGV